MELKIPIEIVFDDVNSVIDELGKLQKYKLGEGDDMTLVDVDDVVDVLTRHVMAREAKEPCGTKEGWTPCSERLPEVKREPYYVDCIDGEVLFESERVLVFGKNEYGYDYAVASYISSSRQGDEWSSAYDATETELTQILAWMPLPEPYGGESDEAD